MELDLLMTGIGPPIRHMPRNNRSISIQDQVQNSPSDELPRPKGANAGGVHLKDDPITTYK